MAFQPIPAEPIDVLTLDWFLFEGEIDQKVEEFLKVPSKTGDYSSLHSKKMWLTRRSLFLVACTYN